jgi:glutamate dehydrogenase
MKFAPAVPIKLGGFRSLFTWRGVPQAGVTRFAGGAIDALDNRVPDDVQARMFVDIARLLERAALWFPRYLQAGAVDRSGAASLLARCRDAVQRLVPQLPALFPEADLEALAVRQGELVNAGVESTLALRVAGGEISVALLDIAELAASCGQPLELVAATYFALDMRLNYGWIGERAAALPPPTHWDTTARAHDERAGAAGASGRYGRCHSARGCLVRAA